MIFEVSGFFPVPERATQAIELLNNKGFDTTSAALVTGEDARDALHRRLAAAKRGRAAAGAAVCGGIALLLGGLVFLPAPGATSYPWLLVGSMVALFALIGAAIGGYYGMAVERESVLVGLLVGSARIEEAKAVLRSAGARFLGVKRVAGEGQSFSRA